MRIFSISVANVNVWGYKLPLYIQMVIMILCVCAGLVQRSYINPIGINLL